MGVVKTISANCFPKQSDYLYKVVEVVFNYDLQEREQGIIVRDDLEAPHQTIIKLRDGRYVLSTECQYRFV